MAIDFSSWGITRGVSLIALTSLLIIACSDDDGDPTGPDPTGSIEVLLTISGTPPDADGCLFTVDGSDSRRLLAGETTTFSGLAAGQHEVSISDVAGHCEVLGDAIRSVAVVANQTASVVYAVNCLSPPGSITVNVTTTGEDLDADGFQVVVDGGAPSAIDINGSMTEPGLAPGDYTVELQGLAFNCSADGPNPRQVTVTADAETPATFDVTCRYHLYDRIAYVSMTATEMMLHSVDPETRVIRSLGIEGEHPAVSPDGLWIAYDWNQDIWVAASDGSSAVNITNSGEGEEFPAWSPDGSQLVYTRDGALFTMNADGSDWTPLWIVGWAPTWSPDGTQIAYTSSEGVSNAEIWVISPDGQGQPQRFNVTNHPAWDAHPAWSPLGDLIAFSTDRDTNRDVYAAAPTGGPAVDMTGSVAARAYSPSWSPSAHAVAFQSDAGGNFDIMYYEPGSVLPVLLTDGPAQDVQPSWGGGN
ncbi:MAG: hypothetical protein M8861_11130 [marine benthic group bacterium]|nr:hypothetical protein [Gemmatimonadota bacterium]